PLYTSFLCSNHTVPSDISPLSLHDALPILFVSNTVHDHVRDRLPFLFEDLGEQQVKNIARPVRVYRVRDAASKATSPRPALSLPDRKSTRLNSSHVKISYAVFCLKKKTKTH